jgi:hypothetical protein
VSSRCFTTPGPPNAPSATGCRINAASPSEEREAGHALVGAPDVGGAAEPVRDRWWRAWQVGVAHLGVVDQGAGTIVLCIVKEPLEVELRLARLRLPPAPSVAPSVQSVVFAARKSTRTALSMGSNGGWPDHSWSNMQGWVHGGSLDRL